MSSKVNQFYTRIPDWLFDELRDGKINTKMFLVLCWLFHRANWNTGIVRRVSAKRIQQEVWADDREDDRCSLRTIQEYLWRFRRCGYLKSNHVLGQRGTYVITLNNYTALKKDENDTLTEVTLRPTTTIDWHDLPACRCADKEACHCAEASTDASGEASTDASAYTTLCTNLPSTLSPNFPQGERKGESQIAPSAHPGLASLENEQQDRGGEPPHPPALAQPAPMLDCSGEPYETDPKGLAEYNKFIRDSAEYLIYGLQVPSQTWDSLLPVATQVVEALCTAEVCSSWEAGFVAAELLRWNKAHKTGKLVIGSDLNRLLKAVSSTKGQNIVQQWLACCSVEGRRACRSCSKIEVGETLFSEIKLTRPWIAPTQVEVKALMDAVAKVGEGIIGFNTKRTKFLIKSNPNDGENNLLKWEGDWSDGWNAVILACCRDKKKWDELRTAAEFWVPSAFEGASV